MDTNYQGNQGNQGDQMDQSNQMNQKNQANSDGNNQDKGDKDPYEQGGKPNPSGAINFLIVGLLLTMLLNFMISGVNQSMNIQIEYSQFVQLVESGMVGSVQIEDEKISLTLKEAVSDKQVQSILNLSYEEMNQISSGEYVFYTGAVEDPNLVSMLSDFDVRFYKPVIQNNAILSFMSSWIFPLIIMYIIYIVFMRAMMKRMGGSSGGMMGGMMNVGKTKAKMYTVEENTGITFADVAGQDEAKESLTEMVDFLHNPEKYQEIGAKQPKGALLVGPPGTGKTLLAKAMAGEAKVPFFSLSGSEFVEMFVGVGASRVRDLFEQASKEAPCIVFIDEIDAIGKKRDSQMGSNDEREQTLNQLLAEMDGFDSSKGIVVMAATNRPEILDKALLRPGRFDRRIIVEKPDLPGREAILKVHGSKVKLDVDVNLREIALATSGATGADLANMINEAALRAVKLGRNTVLQEDLMESVEVVIAGKEKKDRVMNKTERRMVAYHEVGHALASALQKNSQPVQKITIVPRTMGSLGYTMNMPEEERYLLTKSEILAQITTLLAGRAAEEIEFGESSTGASNDIERATKLARSMVTQYGMSDKFGMMGLESIENQYLDGRNVATCSEQTGSAIDEEVRMIIESCRSNAIELLNNNKSALSRISEYLLEKENITGEEFMNLLHAEEKAS